MDVKHTRLRVQVFLFLLPCFFALAGTAHASTTTQIFGDTFDTLSTGELSGQNGWVAVATGVWSVTATTSGNFIRGGNSSYNTSVVSQTSVSSKDTRVVVDFKAPTSGQAGIHVWLRRTGTTSSASGYDLFLYSDGNLYLDYISGASASVLNSTPVSFTPGAWYTIEFEVVNDGSGNPVLSGWFYAQNSSRPGSPTITYTDTSKYLPNAGYVGLGGFNNSVDADTVRIYTGDSGYTVPDAPMSLLVTPNFSKVALSWTPPASTGGSAITDYEVEYRTGTNPFATYADGISTSTSVTITGLSQNTSYDFRVSAVSTVGTSTAATISTTTLSALAQQTPILIDHMSAGGPNGATTAAFDSTGATLLIATVSVYGSPASSATVSDSAGNIWHALTDYPGNANIHTAIWYAYNKSGGPLTTSTSHTLTVTDAGSYPAVDFSAWSGTATSSNPFDVQNGTGAASTSISSGDITSSENSELIISTFGADKAGTYTVDSPFTLLGTKNYQNNNNMGNGSGYDIQITSGSASAMWHSTASGDVASAVAAFKAQTPLITATTPSSPQSLESVESSHQVTLSWTTPSSDGGSPITDYVIQYRTGANSFTTFNDGVSTDLSAIITGLAADTAYNFKIFAINAYGTSSAATITATTSVSNITITSPSRAVSAEPFVATIAIPRAECNTTFYIPYIQTSTSLNVSASVDPAALPLGGGSNLS